MFDKITIFRKGVQLLSSQAVVQALRFIRNVILARLLTPADFGVAATFWLTTGFLSTLTQFGVEQMLIRDKDGDKENVGATAQTFFLLRGILIGVAIVLVADPAMYFLGAPKTANAFRWIALSSVLTGLVHRDTLRMQRDLRFGASIACQLGPDLIVTALAWPIAVWCRDYTAFVYFAILQSILSVVTSHLVAERKFRLGWDPEVVRRCYHFGWPLFLNALLMYFALQGDRMVLANAYTMTELGYYSVAMMLTLTPATMLLGVASQLMIPALARVQDDKDDFALRFKAFCRLTGFIAVQMSVAFFLFSDLVIDFLYGSKYHAATVLLGPLALAQSIRLVRLVPTTAALALGDSKCSLFANLCRMSGFILSVVFAFKGYSFVSIALASIVGEFFAMLLSVLWIQLFHGLDWKMYFPIVVMILITSLILANRIWNGEQINLWLEAAIAGLVSFAALIYLLVPIFLNRLRLNVACEGLPGPVASSENRL